MKIGIIGTGRVAQALSSAWSAAGHDVTLGSRTPDDHGGSVAIEELVRSHDVIVNATPGSASEAILTSIDADAWAGRVLIDVANQVTPPTFDLLYPNDSLGRRLQAALPEARVVKTMNTAPMSVFVAPESVGSESSVFLSGDDADAKATVGGLLRDLGWTDDSIIDLGGIVTARGPEHYFLLYFALVQSVGAPLNLRIIQPN